MDDVFATDKGDNYKSTVSGTSSCNKNLSSDIFVHRN